MSNAYKDVIESNSDFIQIPLSILCNGLYCFRFFCQRKFDPCLSLNFSSIRGILGLLFGPQVSKYELRQRWCEFWPYKGIIKTIVHWLLSKKCTRQHRTKKKTSLFYVFSKQVSNALRYHVRFPFLVWYLWNNSMLWGL